jgi:hypothetical protein
MNNVVQQERIMALQIETFPTSQVQLDPGWSLSGGGALDDWTGDGNLLTASFPQGEAWFAFGKDHKTSSPAAITACDRPSRGLRSTDGRAPGLTRSV